MLAIAGAIALLPSGARAGAPASPESNDPFHARGAAAPSGDAARAPATVAAGLRAGVRVLRLSADAAPVLRARLDRYIAAANASIRAYDATVPASLQVPALAFSDFDLDETALELVPFVRARAGRWSVQAELPLAFTADSFSVGIGLYPVRFTHSLPRYALDLHAGAGITASFSHRTRFTSPKRRDLDVSASGAIVNPIRLTLAATHAPFTIELGVSPIVLGILVDPDRFGTFSPPPDPSAANALLRDALRTGRGYQVDVSLCYPFVAR